MEAPAIANARLPPCWGVRSFTARCPLHHAPQLKDSVSRRRTTQCSTAAPSALSSNGVALHGAHTAEPVSTSTLTSLASRDGDTPCDDEVGGCVALWEDTDDFWSRPTLSTPAARATLLDQDPGLNQNLISSGTTVSQIFNQDTWERHRAPGRYWLYMQRIAHSTVLRRIIRPCTVFVSIAAAVCGLNAALPATWPKLAIPLVPHTLLGAAVSLLMVFRTNSSYARFVEGRALWGALVRHARDWARLLVWWPAGELRGRAARYIQCLAFVLKSHLRQGRKRNNANDPSAFRDDPTAVVNELLPCCEATQLLQQPNRPFFLLCKMSSLVRDASLTNTMPRHIQHVLEHTLSELMAVVGGCDRILGTPIPLSYTRHTSRSLVIYLATLPLALWAHLGWLSVPTMAFIAFIFLGIDEIGVEIEEPFCILPLLPLCRTIVTDVASAMDLAAEEA